MKAPVSDFRSRAELIARLLTEVDPDTGKADPAEAERQCRIGLEAGDTACLSWLCDALVAQGRGTEARKTWNNALESGDPLAWYQVIEWLMGSSERQNDPERGRSEAERVLEDALRLGIRDERLRELHAQLILRER